MNKKITIIGAGIGGLCSAISLARKGFRVKLHEAGQKAGGLASGFSSDGYSFDSGPYILLDRPGLDWAFTQLGLSLEKELKLIPVENIYEVNDDEGNAIRFNRSIDQTAGEFEKKFPGSGDAYKKYVAHTFKIHNNLKPFTYISHPTPLDVIRNGSLRYVPFLLSSLGSVMRKTHLPSPLVNAISIWTHIAGQPLDKAPSPMAFVPGLFHNVGSYYPEGGIRQISLLLEKEALKAGVEIIYNSRVESIETKNGKVMGVKLVNGETEEADAVLSNASAIGTYRHLLPGVPESSRKKYEQLPLQSPGVCAYLSVKGKQPPYYIRFRLKKDACIAFIQPALLDPTIGKDGWYPARLLAPLHHDIAEGMTREQQLAHLESLLAESWWKEGISEYEVKYRRTSYDWGREFNLYRNSMNPVMTASFMLKGRFAHRSPHAKGLFLAGSSTHPGQWVSFCAISGIIAANMITKDLGNA